MEGMRPLERMLHSSRFRMPNVFVCLKLEADIEPIRKNPFDKLDGFQFTPDDRHQDRTMLVDSMLCDYCLCPIVVGAIAYDELHFILGIQVLDVLPQILFYHTAGWALEIHDTLDPGINAADIETPPGFNKDFKTLVAEERHQLMHVFLKERIPSRHFDQPASVTFHLFYDRANRHLLTLFERIRCIAIRAADIAVREANED